MTFPIVLVCGLLWLRLVIGHWGPDAYAFIALIVGLQFLLGFLDFGTAAHVLEAAGRYRSNGDVRALGGALGAAWRTILIGNLLLLGGAVALSFGGVWGVILGFPDRPSTAGSAVVGILAVNTVVRPLSLSTALVAGLGRPAVATWSQALTGVSSLGLLAVLLPLEAPLASVTMTPIAGQLLAFLLPFLLSLKAIPGLAKATLRGMRRSSRSREKLRQLAIPMLLIQAIGPLNDQLDRVVLSHLSTVEALAMYSLGAQLLASAESFITALTPLFWAEFAELRAKAGPRAAVARSLTYIRRLWVLAVLLGVAFYVLSWTLSPLISDGQLRLSWTFCAVLGATLPLAAISIVLGIGLTDPRSLRMQPVILCVTTGVNLALTVLLAAPLGAVGPALASLIATLVHLPLLSILAWRRLHGDPSGDDGGLTGSVEPVTADSVAPRRDA